MSIAAPEPSGADTSAPWVALQQQGAVASERGDFRGAQRAYERAIRLCRADVDDDEAIAVLYGDLGDAYLEAGEVEDALNAYREARSRHQARHNLLGLAVTERRLGTAYRAKGDPRRAADAYDDADALLRQIHDDAERARLLTCIGELHEESGQYQPALEAYREALAINQARSDDAGVILSLRLIGSALQELGDLAGAAEALNRATALLQVRGSVDKPELVEVTNLLGAVLEDQGELAEALALFEEALELAEDLELEPARAETLQHLASVHHHRGDLEEAIDCLERAISIAKGLKDDVTLSLLYGDLGDVYLERGDPEKAVRNVKEALYRDQAHQDLLGMAVNHRRLGSAYQAQGEFERAEEAYEEAEALLLRTQDEGERAVLLTQRGSLHEELGEYEKALASYSKALAINEAQRHDVGTIICLRHLGSTLVDTGEVATAAQHLERALVLLESHGDEDVPELIEVSNLLGAVHEARGDVEDALLLYRRSLELAERLEHEPLQAQSLFRIGSADCRRGNFDRGRERYESALKIWKQLDDEVEIAEVQAAIGRSYEDERELSNAIRHYLAGLRIARRLELPPALMRLALGLARCYRQLHDVERIADVLEEVQEVVDIDSAPFRGEFWVEAGRLAEMRDDADDAAENYEKALEYYKARGDAVNALECQRLLLHASLARGDSDTATRYLLQTLALSPDDVRLAWSAMLGQYHPAIAAAAIPAFKVGDYWSAIGRSFLACEELLRTRLQASSRDKAVWMVDQWFQPDRRGIRPWADADELAGFREFCRGAFRSRRNPQSHRSTMEVDAAEAVAWLSVTHLIASLIDQPDAGTAGATAAGTKNTT